MKITNEMIQKLQALKGLNLDVAFRVFREKKLDVKQSGFVENVIALLLDRDLPKNDRGMDFKGLFEVKEIKVNFTKRTGEMRTGGDTAISAYLNYEPNFFQSNIWDKSNKILIVCIDKNRIVVDVRFFDGEPYAEQMNKNYEEIKKFKNLCRQNNRILVFKTGRNSIMLKGNTAIDMSTSILSDENNEIVNQDSYIREMFDDKFSSYEEKIKSIFEKISLLMNRVSIADLQSIKKLADLKIEESMGFDMNAGSELPFKKNIKIMDIGSGKEYPANALSNFAPHPFIFDGVECNSMEGLLQSFKFANFEMQKEVCKLVGKAAKFKGKPKKWFMTQKLYWNNIVYNRNSKEYQELLDRAYEALSNNTSFQKAVLTTGKATLTHEIGKSKENETILTKREFISRLYKIRDRLTKEKCSFKFSE